MKKYGYSRRRYSTSSRFVKRRTKRAIKKYRKYSRIPKGVSIQANIPRVQKIRYVQDLALTMSTGAPAYYQFRANGIYDPDYTGGGHQPMRYDQMAQFYANYTVIGSKITIKHVGVGASNAPFKMVLYLNDKNITSLLYVNDLIEQGRCKYIVTSSGIAQKRQVISLGFSSKKFFGLANIKDNTDRIGSAIDNNPSDAAIFIFAVQPLDGTSTISAEQFLVTIDYLVWFSQPIQLTTS